MNGPQSDVLLDVKDGVARITLNRPERGNGVTYALAARLHDVVAEVASRRDVRVVVLTGAGRQFCVGGDLAGDAFAAARQDVPVDDDVRAQIERGRLTEAIRALPQITIAAVNGGCAGAGLALALACDLRIAAEHAVLRTAYLDAGVSGDYGITWLLPALLGEARARELLLLSEKLDAQTALRYGLLHRVVSGPALNGTADAFAERCAARAPLAVAAIKENLAGAAGVPLGEHLAAEARRQVATARSADAAEAAAAFLARRPPVFHGR
ncbi:enoyl-CoA hydratase [Dactylosporangium maewongense]|uniref:Enoyl-CoA hydratase n=1 Tax=Dactylosporangium maewongense TaxID=634393 RepID=A0ABN1ZPX1_9ACTN